MNKEYTFIVEYRNGLRVTPFKGGSKNDPFEVRVYINKTKVNTKLTWNTNGGGAKWVEEEIINSKDFKLPWVTSQLKSNHFTNYYYKGYVPYIVEFYDLSLPKEESLIYTDVFDPREKLVNFTLHSEDPITLHTWMCAIEKFKKENQCDISIVNDYLKKHQPYSFVDAYFSPSEEFYSYYAGYQIGRFGTENAPDLQKNPDGIQGKNDLEIIEDILYHYTKSL